MLVVGGWVPVGLGLRLGLDLGLGEAVSLKLGPALGNVLYVDHYSTSSLGNREILIPRAHWDQF